MIVYFSGTGNSKFAAEFLGKQLNDEVLNAGERIKAGNDHSLQSDSPWVFVAPIYAWRMAAIFSDYIQRTKLLGNQDAYFVLTCGGDIGNAGKYAAQLCQTKGLCYRGVMELVMPENYIAMFKAPDLEESKRIVSLAKPVLERAGQYILDGLNFPVHKTNCLDRLKSGAINDGFYRLYVKADGFWVKDNCIGCGLCQDVCPLNNIRVVNDLPHWGNQCTHCMACICRCPVEAIEYGKKSRGRRRYQCPGDESV